MASKTSKTTKTETPPTFEFFEGVTGTRSNAPRITVRKGGVMVITPAALAMLGDGVEYVQVGIDPSNKAIGIRRTEERGRGCYRLQTQRSSKSMLIGSKRFFAHHNIDTGTAQTFDAEQLTEGIIGFHLPATDK